VADCTTCESIDDLRRLGMVFRCSNERARSLRPPFSASEYQVSTPRGSALS
jgi:hypothetical protein